ncbi:N-alpha-acetyltransferase 80 [Archocentrus centrarchus]|uniref:N-alpha-acetyltransferase 80 n=1 Tax=Archocentrus centrarchus TaxID=63155 RepID=UPI0011E9BE8A|nr:N-alpha-acetyltransferase 80-like [Archocentrus centrarchus]
MSEPVTSASDCQRRENVCEVSTLDGDVKEKLHIDPEQPEKIRIVPIHLRPDLLAPCSDLVNSEWQRSQAARIHSLQKSCSEFPVNLVLLQGRRETERLLGHARLSRVVGRSSSLFVESVVVSKAERGKGYGRTLMEETECYARNRGFKRLCLTTHDKQHFYAHLGYVLSTPVQNAGAMTAFIPMETLLRFSRMPSEDTSVQKQTKMCAQGNRDSGGAYAVGSSLLFRLPPPPPPLPPTIPCPPPPPPPPPPPESTGQLIVQTLTDTPYRDAKGVPIYWMHKDI